MRRRALWAWIFEDVVRAPPRWLWWVLWLNLLLAVLDSAIDAVRWLA